MDNQDIFGEAMHDFLNGKFEEPLLLYNEYGPPEEIPPEAFFIDEDGFDELEDYALTLCYGKILDVGAAAGRHSLHLQNQKKKVFALDNSPTCCKIMTELGLQKVICEDMFQHKKQNYDTILLLMNGIGLGGTEKGAIQMLKHFTNLLKPNGQIICDSSDIEYLYEDIAKPLDTYYGELKYQYDYKGRKGPWFNWLYADPKLMGRLANEAGYNMQILYSETSGRFLTRLTLR